MIETEVLRHKYFISILLRSRPNDPEFIMDWYTPEEVGAFVHKMQHEGVKLSGRNRVLTIHSDDVVSINYQIVEHGNYEENMRKGVHKGTFQQCYFDGTPIPSKYYSGWISSWNGVVVSAGCEDLVGHESECDFVKDVWELAAETASNSMSFKSGRIGNQNMTPPRPCNCKKSRKKFLGVF